jgi:hypothetical protein
VADLLITAYAVWLLLTAYRVIGKAPGADEKYDAWHRRSVFMMKLLGWMGVVIMGSSLVLILLWGW